MIQRFDLFSGPSSSRPCQIRSSFTTGSSGVSNQLHSRVQAGDRSTDLSINLTLTWRSLSDTLLSNEYGAAHSVQLLSVDAIGTARQAVGPHLADFDPSENASSVDTEKLGHLLNGKVGVAVHCWHLTSRIVPNSPRYSIIWLNARPRKKEISGNFRSGIFDRNV